MLVSTKWEKRKRGTARTRAHDGIYRNGRGPDAGAVQFLPTQRKSESSRDSDAGVARAWRGRGAGYRQFLGMSGAGVARAWRGRGAGMSCDPRRLRDRVLQGG
eukprot:gene9632-biopygen22739